MIYYIRKALKKEAVQYWGRGGIFYFDGMNEFYVDSENFVPNKNSKHNYGVLIFPDDVRYKNQNIEIPDEEKKRIVKRVQLYLAKRGIIAELHKS